MEKTKIGVLISGGGTNLQAIIDDCELGKIDGEVMFVGSDRSGVFGLERAKKHGIPSFVVDYAERLKELKHVSMYRCFDPADYDWEDVYKKMNRPKKYTYNEPEMRRRAIIEAELLKEMEKYQFDLIVLAGFMRIFSPYFIDQINKDRRKPRIMNIHPAISPAHPGTDGYLDTYTFGNKVGGCTVHFVDYGEDTGPIIYQDSFPILPDDTLEKVKERGLKLEHQIYPMCIQLFAEDRLRIGEGIYRGRPRKLVEILLAGHDSQRTPSVWRNDVVPR